MSNAFVGIGTVFNRGSSPIAEVTKIDLSEAKDIIDVTSLDSTNEYREHISGLKDGGSITLELNFRRDTFDAFLADFGNDTPQSYSIVLDDEDETTISFNGFVNELGKNTVMDDRILQQVAVKVTGPLTVSAEVSTSYGVLIDQSVISNVTVERIGELDLHASLPVQSEMKACLLGDDGIVNYYLDADDWSLQEDGVTPSNLDGTDGQVMIEIPDYYRKATDLGDGQIQLEISLNEITGGQRIQKFYHAAYEAALDRADSKLASVVNTDANYRGGNNNATWDAAANSLLGKALSNVNRTNFRTYARNRNNDEAWNLLTWQHYMLIYELFIIEHGTLNSQLAVDGTLTEEGYKKGGLGLGVTTTTFTIWNTFNSAYPFVPIGASNSLGTNTGEVDYVAEDFNGAGNDITFKVNRYRGIENPFGHIWKWLDGCNISYDTGIVSLLIASAAEDFADNTDTNYTLAGTIPNLTAFVSECEIDSRAILLPSEALGSNDGTNGWYDRMEGNISSGTYYAVRAGADAFSGTGRAGFLALNTKSQNTLVSQNLGSRLSHFFTDFNRFDAAKIILTFDDANDNWVDLLIPLLDAQGVKATLFIVSEWVGTVNRCTWAELLTMYASGYDMQNHSFDHTSFTTLTDEQIIAQVEDCASAMVANGLPYPNHLAYPQGGYDSDINTLLSESGLLLSARRLLIGYPMDGILDKEVDKFQIPSMVLYGTNARLQNYKDAIDLAVQEKLKLCLYGHNVVATDVEAIDDNYITTELLNNIIDYAQSKGVGFETISQMYNTLA